MRGNHARLFFIFAIMLVSAWIVGCHQREIVKEKTAPALKATKGDGLGPVKEEIATDTMSKMPPYEPSTRWDPFRAPQRAVKPPEKDEPDLDLLKLAGTIKGQGKDAAFLEYPNGKDRIVRTHDTVGKYNGRVAEIGDCYIIVEENYIDPANMNTTFKLQREMRIQDSKCDQKPSQ
jgi:Tfp pilus assembly protein PilP